MNRRTKGIRLEKMACRSLIADGYRVYRVPASRMYQLQEDIFGIWDILCILPYEIKFIQVKSNQKRDISMHKIFAETYRAVCTCEVWVYTDYKGWKKIKL